MPDEIWKDVVGYEGFYQVSNLGQVRSVVEAQKTGRGHSGKMLTQYKVKGYMIVNLSKHGIAKHRGVHRLVADAFLNNPTHLPQVNHKDENPENNHVDNLEWCDSKYNVNYGTRTERCSGEHHGRSVLTKSDIAFIRRNVKVGDMEFGIKGLARMLSVGETTVSHVVHGETWKHLL